MERHRKHGTRRINDLFPAQPSGLGFVKGDLLFNAARLPSQSHTAGQGFEVRWRSEGGGSMQVFHSSEPDRELWCTIPGISFVSAAVGRDSFEECRGSFAIHDKVEIVCSHQSVEQITLAWPSEVSGLMAKPKSREESGIGGLDCEEALTPREDADGAAVGNRGPCVMITGCLYEDPTLARRHVYAISGSGLPSTEKQRPDSLYIAAEDKKAAMKESRLVGVRYRLLFYEAREHQLGFSVSLDSSRPLSVGRPVPVAADGFVGMFRQQQQEEEASGRRHWLWSQAGVSAFSPDRFAETPFRPKSISVGDFRTTMASLRDKCLPRESLVTNLLLSDLKFSKPSEFVSVLHVDDEEDPRFQPSAFNRVQLTYATSKEENFFGFGEQFSHFNFKGRRVPIFVQEQGIGRGDQPVTALANLVSNRAGGDWHTTYAPVPYYMTSEMRSLHLEGYEYAVFDLRHKDAVQIQVHAGSVHGRILHGRTPVEIIERYTAATGRMSELPSWILKGAIVGMQGGSNVVRNVWQQLQDLEVPVAAFWLQDWVGQRETKVGWQLWWNWEVDKDHYPGWEQLVQEFRAQGIRTLAYCNPLLAPTHDKSNRRRDLLAEALRQGFVVRNKFGAPYMIPNTSFDAAMVDLTNPAARKWLKGILHDMVQTGVRGWMADFGEALPLDSFPFSGEDPRAVHNRYPELWAELNREVVTEWEAEQREVKSRSTTTTAGSEDEDDEKLVFFMRAGYRGSPRWSMLFWEGDQMVSWQRNDGIKSAVTGLLTGGLCGYSLNHSDIGGYCTVDVPVLRYCRTEELLLRWMELNAFSTIFRTHEGNVPKANSQFFSNETTLRHFTRFCKVYKAWEFYRLLLVKEAAATGLPVVRHLFLHYPADPHVQTFTYEQFLVGTEILVVPVVDKGRKRVKAYFPRAAEREAWEHVWTGTVYTSSQQRGVTAWIDAPLGEPAVFTKKGSAIGRRFIDNVRTQGLLPAIVSSES